jgi:SAM-dependent methyltransferase
MKSWTAANLRHAAQLFRYGANPAARVYDSLGAELWLAPAPGWLNLGLWDGDGDEQEAPEAVRRLVATLARDLPRDGVLVDVGNGLGAQDPVIAEVARPRQLVAINITESQLRAGRDRLRAAGATPVVGDATALPLRSGAADGFISVEAAFHFSSRARFFEEARRMLRAGGVLSMSDVSVERLPRRPAEVAAGALNLRFWGLRAGAMMPAEAIGSLAERAGLTDVTIERCGDRVIQPAVRLLRGRLERDGSGPPGQRRVAALMLDGWDLLCRRGVIEYILLRARAG